MAENVTCICGMDHPEGDHPSFIRGTPVVVDADAPHDSPAPPVDPDHPLAHAPGSHHQMWARMLNHAKVRSGR